MHASPLQERSRLSSAPPDELPQDRPGGSGGPGIRLGQTLLLFAGVVVIFIGLASVLARPLSLNRLLLIHMVGLLTPCVLFLWRAGQPWRAVLSWRPSSLPSMIGAGLLGASVWYALLSTLMPLQEALLPLPERFIAERAALFGVPTSALGWLHLWIAAALVPAFCEEAFFRGILLTGARSSLRDTRAVLLVALLFSLFHFNPYQLSVTFVQGVVVGWLLLRTGSLLPCILFHLANNTMVLGVGQLESETLPLWASAALVVGLVVGTLLVMPELRLPGLGGSQGGRLRR